MLLEILNEHLVSGRIYRKLSNLRKDTAVCPDVTTELCISLVISFQAVVQNPRVRLHERLFSIPSCEIAFCKAVCAFKLTTLAQIGDSASLFAWLVSSATVSHCFSLVTPWLVECVIRLDCGNDAFVQSCAPGQEFEVAHRLVFSIVSADDDALAVLACLQDVQIV